HSFPTRRSSDLCSCLLPLLGLTPGPGRIAVSGVLVLALLLVLDGEAGGSIEALLVARQPGPDRDRDEQQQQEQGDDSRQHGSAPARRVAAQALQVGDDRVQLGLALDLGRDRKSTRLNSSHVKISYAVFCLKKKKKTKQIT